MERILTVIKESINTRFFPNTNTACSSLQNIPVELCLGQRPTILIYPQYHVNRLRNEFKFQLKDPVVDGWQHILSHI